MCMYVCIYIHVYASREGSRSEKRFIRKKDDSRRVALVARFVRGSGSMGFVAVLGNFMGFQRNNERARIVWYRTTMREGSVKWRAGEVVLLKVARLIASNIW